jgi:hypothetical protein
MPAAVERAPDHGLRRTRPNSRLSVSSSVGRDQLDAQARDRHAHLQAAQAVLDHRHRLAAPAVGTEGGADLAAQVHHRQRREQIPDRLDGVAVDGGGAEGEGVGRSIRSTKGSVSPPSRSYSETRTPSTDSAPAQTASAMRAVLP